MNHLFKTCALVVGLAPVVRAQTAPVTPAPVAPAPATTKADVNPLNVPVEAPAPAASSSQALHALAKGAGASLLADADEVDASPADAGAPAAPEGVRRLRGRLNDWSAAHKLNWKWAAGGTLLVWSAPDPFDILARWKADTPAVITPPATTTPAKEDKVTGPPTPEPSAPVAVAASLPGASSPELALGLSRFFATPAARRVADNPGSWRDVPVSQLPAALREQILALSPVAPQASANPNEQAQNAVLGDDFWKTATLRVQNIDLPTLGADGKAEHHLTPMLFLSGHFVSPSGARGSVMLGLTFWPKP